MKFYNLNGTWVSWEELHNEYGYSTVESTPVTYKSASNDATWGSDAGSGYYVGDVTDMIHGSFWCDSDYGWFELDGLVWNPEIYPSNATPLTMINNGVLSDAVSLECGGVTYYLIKAIVGSYAWISASEAAEMGWEVSTGYTLSFVNTQLPDITITMPPSETGPSGTVVTLPTMSGEYESGGKTWTPSAWDIGAFGSSYTITADTIAHLVFEEVETYEEIRLYINGAMTAQYGVTSSFNGNVNSTYIYNLYTDSEHTTLWKGFDYSHRYEIGSYVNGTWKKRRQAIEEMPDTTTTSGWVFGFILLDTSKLWLVTDCTNPATFTVSSIRVRIYRKEQQVFSFYFNSSSVYNNVSLSYNSTYYLYSAPNLGSSSQVPSQKLPGKTLIRFLGSAGNVVSVGTDNFGWYWASPLQVNYNKTNSGTLAVRNVEVSFSEPIYYAMLYVDNITTSKNTAYALFNEDGTPAQVEAGYTYTVAVLFKKNNGTSTSQNEYINSCELGEFMPDLPGRLCLRYSYGTQNLVIQHIWYRKTPIS